MERKVMLDKATPPPLPNSVMANNSAEANYGIIDWFKKCLRNYVNFSGRARRKEYWYFFLVQMGVVIVAMLLDAIIFSSETGLFYIVAVLGLFLPGLAVTIRRLHDTSRSGWWFLIGVVPLIGSIILLVFLASDTKPETNKWGLPAK
ncbi:MULTISPECIES: DUF805 domain-containing protein [unclassified Psychrobacter]|uniref:DUF805 domain-containing protein n=1 Tax=unclassified Psychrobacter TaxID=196806 RepID=UPI001D108C55|nr:MULTISPECIES: DUF805 domain-containing protein [unclassified Psychrobacter]